MVRTLDVYLLRDLVGQLTQDNHGEMTFAYVQPWLDNQSARILSRSLPLRVEPFSRMECRGFFAGILPEEGKRKLVARNLGISERNDYSMLEQIGGECAGAVTFMPAGTSLPQTEDRYRVLCENDLANLLNELPSRPLLAGSQDIRLSLAGAQDKIAVYVTKDGVISMPLGGAPSSHILKPENKLFPDLVFNEAFCMRLAGMVGFPVADVQIGSADGIDYLLVERYDRLKSRGINRIRDVSSMRDVQGFARLHQEDFCQALGIVPEQKYQSDGGVSLKQCFELAREVFDKPVIDLQNLLDAVIFNFLIGNHDAHGKNFSLLYGGDDTFSRATRLAPFYDLLSTVYYPDLTPKMAMKMGDEYESAKIVPRHFEQFAEETGLAKPGVRHRVMDLARMVMGCLDKTEISRPMIQSLAKLIHDRCQQTLEDFKGKKD